MKISFVRNKKGVSLVEVVIAVCLLAIFTTGVLTALMYSQTSISGDTKEDARTALASEKMDQLMTMLGSTDYVEKNRINITAESGSTAESQPSPYVNTFAMEEKTGAVHIFDLPSVGAEGYACYLLEMYVDGISYPVADFFDTNLTSYAINSSTNEFILNSTDEKDCSDIAGWYITLRYFYSTDAYYEITGFASNTQGVYY